MMKIFNTVFQMDKDVMQSSNGGLTKLDQTKKDDTLSYTSLQIDVQSLNNVMLNIQKENEKVYTVSNTNVQMEQQSLVDQILNTDNIQKEPKFKSSSKAISNLCSQMHLESQPSSSRTNNTTELQNEDNPLCWTNIFAGQKKKKSL